MPIVIVNHASSKQLAKRPGIVFILGLIVVMGALVASIIFAREYWHYSSQGQPMEITLRNASLPSDEPRKWVTLNAPDLQCYTASETHNSWPESWILGPVDCTNIIIGKPDEPRLILVKFSGAINCSALNGKPITGVLTHLDDHVYDGYIDDNYTVKYGNKLVFILHAGEGPAGARNFAILSLAMAIVFSFMSAYMGRRWWQARLTGNQIQQ